MRLIDMHCDTLSLLMKDADADLRKNQFCVDLQKMKKTGSMAQFFACFIHMSKIVGEDRFTKGFQNALEMIARGKKEFSENANQISLVTSYHELVKNVNAGKMSAFLTIEEGGIVENDMSRLEVLYEEGVRLMTLLWNGENCIGYPNSRDAEVMKKGLKPFGIETLERMNELGVMIDVSHMSDGGFWDVLRYSRKPVVASHSNARALCPHPRNLTDEMIRALAEHGGVAGLNFYPYFVNESGKADIHDLIRHIEHMYDVGGEEFVAIGTDFDGFDDGESEIKNIGEMNCLYEALKKRKFNDSQIEKFWSGNAMRVMREVW